LTSQHDKGWRRWCAAALCLCISLWAVMPTPLHVPSIIEIIEQHAEMIAEHGHSHGLADDIFWALHGHGPDVAEHDHGVATLTAPPSEQIFPLPRDSARLLSALEKPWIVFGIERPPRV
jgi:hypothetical protein